jgi:hypothetical protein
MDLAVIRGKNSEYITPCFQNLPEHILSNSDVLLQLHNKDQ